MNAPASGRRVLGRYELIEPLGKGGATRSYRAKSFGVEGFEKTLVVKEIAPEFAADEAFVLVFLEHVQRALRLSHANLAQVFDLGHAETEARTAYFLATEYVSGLDVATLISRCRATGEHVPLALGVYIGLEVAKALDHAHRRRDEELRPLAVAHGAIAPHAVLVSFDGDVKLTDFGVTRALLTLPRSREGLRRTYAALSPEQAVGSDATVLSDVFSLGTFLYTVIGGVAPFAADSVEETIRSVVRASPPPLQAIRPEVPPEIAEVVMRALSADPEERFPSINALHEELLACTYACGLRAAPGELAAFVDRHRVAPEPVPPETIDALLSRPVTVPPPSVAPESGPDGFLPRLTSVPPLTGFGELRHVSVLALHLSDPSASGGANDPRVRAIVERYGGVLERVEDAALATALFGLDRSDGRDTELAVRCGLVLARTFDGEVGRAAVGVDAGRVRTTGDLQAAPDERTDRLVQAARSLSDGAEGQVVVSPRAAEELHGRFPLEAQGAGFRVKEFAQDHFVESFVGRKDELRKVGEALVRAARGELRIIRVAGEPGVGKTRLAVELQRRLSRGSVELVTHFATCPPRGRELPNSGLVAMLRRVCGVHDGDPPELVLALEPRLRALGMSAEETEAVLAEIGRAPAGGRVPSAAALRSAFLRVLHGLSEDRFTVFVWDDAHELDGSSCDVLVRAAQRFSSSRLALVLSGRTDPGAPYGAVAVHSDLVLGDLADADVERLVAERAFVTEVPVRLLEFLRERGGGQPLYIEQLVKQLLETGKMVVEDGRVTTLTIDEGVLVPRSLRALTAERLRRLGADERHLFVAAAVLEAPAELDVLARMVELPLPAVEEVVEALAALLLLGREGHLRFTFPSPLAREVVLAELDREDLSRLHRRAADALSAFLGEHAEEEADSIGYHLAAAGDLDAAAEQYARTGLHHFAAKNLERAVQGLGYALGLANLETRSPEQIGNWLAALAAAIRYVHGAHELIPLVERLAERATQDPPAPPRTRIDIACILGALGQELAGEALLDRTASEARGQPALAAVLLSAYADLASNRGDFRAARRALDPLSRVEVADALEVHRIALANARTLAAGGKDGPARDALAQAARAVPADDRFLALDRACVRTAIELAAGRLGDASDAASQASAQAEELGLVYHVASSLSDLASALCRLGEATRARAAALSALNAAEEVNAERIALRTRAILEYLESADGDGVELMLRDRIAELESRGWIGDAILVRYLLGLSCSRRGDVPLSKGELRLASRIAAKAGNQAMADLCIAEGGRISSGR